MNKKTEKEKKKTEKMNKKDEKKRWTKMIKKKMRKGPGESWASIVFTDEDSSKPKTSHFLVHVHRKIVILVPFSLKHEFWK